MRLRLRAFGITRCSVTFDAGPLLELLDESPEGITGGSGQAFERDTEPLIPERRTQYEYEEKHLGFH